MFLRTSAALIGLTVTALLPPSLRADVVSASAGLTLVEESGFNQIDVSLLPNGGTVGRSTDQTTLTGTVTIDIEYDLDADQALTLALRDGRADATDMSFADSTPTFSYAIDFKDLTCAVFTETPPATITNPATGGFEASDHLFQIDGGTATGNVTPSFVPIPLLVSENFAPPNQVEGSGEGTGSLVLTPTGTSGGFRHFHLIATLPILVEQDLNQTPYGYVGVLASGTVKAEGPISIPESPYARWAVAEGLENTDPQADDNGDGLPNALAWAYGLGGDDDGSHLRPIPRGDGGFEIPLPAGGTIAPVRIRRSSDLDDWSDLPAGRISGGENPLPIGKSGKIYIAPSGDPREFLILEVDS